MPTRPTQFRAQKLYDKGTADRLRGNSAERGYDALWRRLRAWFLRHNPRCTFCLERGVSTKATVVDHIKSIEEAPELRLDPSNLRSLCDRCHNRRTAIDQGIARDRQRGAGGLPPRAG
jgi:5-methylcytosine-specific restriction protein A